MFPLLTFVRRECCSLFAPTSPFFLRCDRHHALSHELPVCASSIFGSAGGGIGCCMGPILAHLQVHLFELCFEISWLRLHIIHCHWTGLSMSFHKSNCLGGWGSCFAIPSGIWPLLVHPLPVQGDDRILFWQIFLYV
jgi:hypothetical protein